MFRKRFLAPLVAFSWVFDAISSKFVLENQPATRLIIRHPHLKNLPYLQQEVTSATDLTRAGRAGAPTQRPRDLAGRTNYDIRTASLGDRASRRLSICVRSPRSTLRLALEMDVLRSLLWMWGCPACADLFSSCEFRFRIPPCISPRTRVLTSLTPPRTGPEHISKINFLTNLYLCGVIICRL